MSLISDALRKARQEAAEREARQRGAALPPGMAARASRSRLGTGLVVGAVIAMAAAVTGGGAVWWVLGSGHGRVDTAPADPSRSTHPSDGVRPTPGVAVTAEITPSTGSVEEQQEAVSQPAPAETMTAPAVDEASVEEDPPPGLAELEPVIARQQSPSSGSSDAGDAEDGGSSSERTFILEADLGTVVLSLDYIVYRPSSPYAEINGTEVRVGSIIEGLVVEEIQAGHVKLRDDDGVVVLKAR